MKTEDLIAALAADKLPRPSLRHRMTAGLGLATVAVVLLFAFGWGLRPGLAAALMSPALLKTVVPLLVLSAALALAHRLALPGQSGQVLLALLGGGALLMTAILGGMVVQQGIAALSQALLRPSLAVCLLSIPFLALPFLGGLLWALSHGAVLRPRLTGAITGLAAGAGATVIYSLYCDQDSALFVLPAYGTAMAVVGLAGAMAGRRALRW